MCGLSLSDGTGQDTECRRREEQFREEDDGFSLKDGTSGFSECSCLASTVWSSGVPHSPEPGTADIFFMLVLELRGAQRLNHTLCFGRAGRLEE